MNKQEIKKYLLKQDIFPDAEIQLLGKGNNSSAFLLKKDKQQYTLRIAKSKNKDLLDAYSNHYKILKFLEFSKINFTQKAYFFDPKELILISEFLTGHPITNKRLSTAQLELIFTQLHQVHSVPFANFKKYCKNNKLALTNPENPIINLKEFGSKPFNFLEKNCQRDELVNWIRPRLKESLINIKAVDWNKTDTILHHGDLTGANILKNKNTLYFIDWDRGRYVHTIDYGLSYMFLHYDYFANKSEQIIKYYAKIAGLDEQKLRQGISIKLFSTKLNDVIWASKKYTILHKSKSPGWRKYLILAKQRIKEFDSIFN